MEHERTCTRTTKTVRYTEKGYHPDVNNGWFTAVAAQRGSGFGGVAKKGRH
jgi:hypothetical protein